MRICRIGSYPYNATPGAGLLPYYVTKYIPEPCLYITRWLPGSRLELPEHAHLMAVRVSHVTTTGAIQTLFFHNETKASRYQRLVSFGRIISKLRETPFLLRSALALLRFRPDIVCVHFLKNSILGLLGKHLLGAKFIYYSHNVSEPLLLQRLALLRWIIGQADLVYAVSSEIADQMVGIVPVERIRVTSTGVDLGVFCAQNKLRQERLLTVGRLKWKKGYTYLLEALPRIFAEHPNYTLVVAGDGEERGNIVAQIEALGLQDKIELIGEVPQDEIVKLSNESRLLVLASLAEGLPKAMLEALACGMPVVVTDACNGAEIIRGAGIEVPARDSQALAGAVNKLLSDDDLWQQYAANARSRVQAYDWEAIAHDHYQEYRRLMAADGR